MFKRKKATEFKKVIDVKFEVTENFEEDKGCLAHLIGFFRVHAKREMRKMPLDINKIREKIKKLPKAPHPAIPAKEVWLSLWGCVFGSGVYIIACFSLEVPYVIRAVWRQCSVDFWRL